MEEQVWLGKFGGNGKRSNRQVHVKNGQKNGYPTKSHGNTDQWQTMQDGKNLKLQLTASERAEDG